MCRLIPLRCLGCGRVLHAAAQDAAGLRCSVCGEPVFALGKLVPPPLPKQAPPTAGHRPPGARQGRWAVAVCFALTVLGLLGVGGEVGFLEAGRRADNEQLANGAVAAKVEMARKMLAGKHWNDAAEVLNEALATADATELAAAQELLDQVQPARQADVLAQAEHALRKQDVAQTRRLLQAYLGEPGATERDRAARLLDDLELATSAARADEALRQLSDGALAAIAAGQSPAALHRFADGFLQALHVQTLQAQLGLEQKRRDDLRRELRQQQERRLARLRATAAGKELASFMDALRQGRASVRADRRLLGYLFQELNITDPAEQSRTLSELTGRPPDAEALRKSIARERLGLKERFRAYPGFVQAERESFEQLVDQELNRLLQEISGSKAAP